MWQQGTIRKDVWKKLSGGRINEHRKKQDRKDDLAADLDITEELATMVLKTLQRYIHNIHGDCGKCICAKGRCWMGGCEEVETSASNLDTKNDRIGQEGENK